MAASDARPVPRKNTAFRLYYAIRKSDGTLITSWSGADSEVSIDGASFSDCTNEATEIGTTGCGYIDFTAAEMNGDAIVYKLTVTNTGALPVVVTMFPEEVGDYRVNVEQFGGTAGTFSNGRPEVNATHWGGTAVASANVLIDGAITAAKIAADAGAEVAAAVRTELVTELARIDVASSTLGTAAELAKVPKSDGTVGWNATARAQIQQEAEDALAAYDPPTKAELDAAVSPLATETNATMNRTTITSAVDALPTLSEFLDGGDVDGYTLEQALKLILAACAGKLSGAATTTNVVRAADDSKARITATCDSDGNRTAVTLDATG